MQGVQGSQQELRSRDLVSADVMIAPSWLFIRVAVDHTVHVVYTLNFERACFLVRIESHIAVHQATCSQLRLS